MGLSGASGIMPLEHYVPIYIRWVDACHVCDWHTPETIHTWSYEVCETVGFLVDETKDAYKIALTIGRADGSAADGITIPKQSVIKRAFLKLGTALRR